AANTINEWAYVEDEKSLDNNMTVNGANYLIVNNYGTVADPTATFYLYTDKDQASAETIALGLNAKFSNTKTAIWDFGNLKYIAASGLSIQAAINAASPGDTIDVAAGTFNENILVDKRLSIIGQGSDVTTIAQTQAGAGDSKIGVVQLAASGLSDLEPVLLQDLSIKPTSLAGISVGRFTEATGQSVEYVKLDHVKVIGTNTSPSTEQERGLHVDRTSSLSYLVVENCAFDNLTYGWYFMKDVSADTSNVQYVTVTGTTFNHNNHKGIYAEKLSDATFTGCTVDQNGFDSAALPSYFAPWSAGVDINLKAGTYSNFEFNTCTITANAIDESKEGVGLTVKGRGTGNDPGSAPNLYGLYPATVSNVEIFNCTVEGNERGIRFGEPGKNNTTPTNISVTNCYIQNNVQHYAGADGTEYGGVVNTLDGVIVGAEENWWGNASGPYHATLNAVGAGDDVSDNVDFTPWWNEDSLWVRSEELDVNGDPSPGGTSFADVGNTAKGVTTNGGVVHGTEASASDTVIAFDGVGDYLSLAHSTDWNFASTDFTIDMWVNFEIQPTATQGILGAYNGGLNGYYLYCNAADGFGLHVKNNGVWSAVISHVPAVAGDWHHLAIVGDDGTVTLYVDGIAATTTVTTPVNSGGTGLVIGRLTTNLNNYYFKGHMDEVRVDNTARWTANFDTELPIHP
ncbi:MAG: hypothetical protein C4518_15575, partial [Desulfobacteraceae bacterium]